VPNPSGPAAAASDLANRETVCFRRPHERTWHTRPPPSRMQLDAAYANRTVRRRERLLARHHSPGEGTTESRDRCRPCGRNCRDVATDTASARAKIRRTGARRNAYGISLPRAAERNRAANLDFPESRCTGRRCTRNCRVRPTDRFSEMIVRNAVSRRRSRIPYDRLLIRPVTEPSIFVRKLHASYVGSRKLNVAAYFRERSGKNLTSRVFVCVFSPCNNNTCGQYEMLYVKHYHSRILETITTITVFSHHRHSYRLLYLAHTVLGL